MKKKILLLIVLILSFIKTTFGQSSEYAYLVKTTINSYLHANNGDMYVSSDIGNVGSTNYFAGPSTVGNVYFKFMSIHNNYNEVTIKVNNTAIRISNYPDCDYVRERIVLKANFNNGPLSFGGCSFSQILYPLHIIGPTTLESKCTRDVLELTGGYDWQYYIGSKTTPSDADWVDYASAVTSISVNIGDLYASQNIDINSFAIGAPQRSLKFRTGYKANNNYVTPITYQVIGCSPGFKGYSDKKNTSCFYKSDGEIALKLTRDLDENERLVVTLYTKDQVLVGQESKLKPLSFLDANTYTYKWPNTLDYGKYYFLYQTQNKNLVVEDAPNIDNGSSWDKLIKTDEFEIVRAKNVDFTATKRNDKTCFELSDGKIELNITSGETSSYEYIVYELNGAIESIYRDWTTFTGTSTMIENLEEKKYRIKVRDSKGCFAR